MVWWQTVGHPSWWQAIFTRTVRPVKTQKEKHKEGTHKVKIETMEAFWQASYIVPSSKFQWFPQYSAVQRAAVAENIVIQILKPHTHHVTFTHKSHFCLKRQGVKPGLVEKMAVMSTKPNLVHQLTCTWIICLPIWMFLFSLYQKEPWWHVNKNAITSGCYFVYDI